jgi:LPXTG-motif cell wall-anchored protein
MATGSDIQVSGQLGLETADSNPGGLDQVNQHSGVATVSVTPHYVVTQEFPKTGEVEHSVLTWSGIGLLAILLFVVLNKREQRKETH